MLGAMFEHPAPVIGIPLAFVFIQQNVAGLTPWLYKLLLWTLAIPLNDDAAPSISNALMTGTSVPSFLPVVSILLYSLIFVGVALQVFNRAEL